MAPHLNVSSLESLTQAYKNKAFVYLENVLCKGDLPSLMPWRAVNQILRQNRLSSHRM